MTNPNENCLAGMRCPNPKCGSYGPFYMDVIERVLMGDDGSESYGGDQTWIENTDNVECRECGEYGDVDAFYEKEPTP